MESGCNGVRSQCGSRRLTGGRHPRAAGGKRGAGKAQDPFKHNDEGARWCARLQQLWGPLIGSFSVPAACGNRTWQAAHRMRRCAPGRAPTHAHGLPAGQQEGRVIYWGQQQLPHTQEPCILCCVAAAGAERVARKASWLAAVARAARCAGPHTRKAPARALSTEGRMLWWGHQSLPPQSATLYSFVPALH
jgi:hypothetical protein